MPWYTAECLYRSELASCTADEQLCEYRYFLVKADDDQAANEKARELAAAKQHGYLNANGEKVHWVLEAVIDTKQILNEDLSEGTEIFHRYVSRPPCASRQR